jgi:hypothetical protein
LQPVEGMRIGAVIVAAGLWAAVSQTAAPDAVMQVRHPQGALHGFLSVRTLQDAPVADGSVTQEVSGDRITNETTYRFRDGSRQVETVVYTQRGQFRVLSDHLVQQGPTFPYPVDLTVDALTGNATTVTTDGHGKPKVLRARFDPTPALANGIVEPIVENAPDDAFPLTLPMELASPAPILVRLQVSVVGDTPFSVGAWPFTARHYVIKLDVGGVRGLLARLFRKLPPDSQLWVLRGASPAFVQSEQPFFDGAPLWRVDMATPTIR